MRIDNLEKKISKIEGFSIVIRDGNGRDARGDRKILSNYSFEKQAKDNMTVSEWRKQRFRPSFAGFQVDVIMGDKQVASGQTTLSKVRNSYKSD